jgi:hypothetical protein
MRSALLFLVGVVGCGGGATPVDMGGAADFATAPADLSATDLARSGGDLAGCTEPTSGFYILTSSGLSLLLVSPDPDSWDSGKPIALVDGTGNSVEAGHMTVLGNIIYLNQTGRVYQGNLDTIQNGKLVVAADGVITNSTLAGGYYGALAPNGGSGGNLIVSYSDVSLRVGAAQTSNSNWMFTLSDPEIQVTCNLVDFEGAVNGAHSTLTAACGTDLITITDGMMTGTVASGPHILAGIQVQQNATYVMDNLGNLYDGSLNFIKKTRQCLPAGNPSQGQAITVGSM